MRLAVLSCLVVLAACQSPQTLDTSTQLPTIPVRLPNGKVIRAEVARDVNDQQRGLMFRTSLAPDHGMLFVFGAPGPRPFWMYHTLIPLDMLWLNQNRRIVFISANTPPCPSEKPEECPNYGGEAYAQYVLELAGGVAAAQGLKVGDTLQF